LRLTPRNIGLGGKRAALNTRINFSPAGAQQWSKFPAIAPVRLEGAGLATIRLRPELDANHIRVKTVPVEVSIQEEGEGVYKGYTLPIWNDAANVDEELYFRQNVPWRWDGASDIIASVVAVLDTENTGKKFRLQLEWEHFAEGGVVLVTANTADLVERDTDGAAKYQSFVCDFTIVYNIDGPDNEIKSGEVLTARLRRVGASANEITGNVIILDWYVLYRRNKLGAPV